MNEEEFAEKRRHPLLPHRSSIALTGLIAVFYFLMAFPAERTTNYSRGNEYTAGWPFVYKTNDRDLVLESGILLADPIRPVYGGEAIDRRPPWLTLYGWKAKNGAIKPHGVFANVLFGVFLLAAGVVVIEFRRMRRKHFLQFRIPEIVLLIFLLAYVIVIHRGIYGSAREKWAARALAAKHGADFTTSDDKIWDKNTRHFLLERLIGTSAMQTGIHVDTIALKDPDRIDEANIKSIDRLTGKMNHLREIQTYSYSILEHAIKMECVERAEVIRVGIDDYRQFALMEKPERFRFLAPNKKCFFFETFPCKNKEYRSHAIRKLKTIFPDMDLDFFDPIGYGDLSSIESGGYYDEFSIPMNVLEADRKLAEKPTFDGEAFENHFEFLDKQISQFPDDPGIYFHRALVNARLGRTEESIKDWKKVCELRPNSWKALYQVGALYSKIDKFQDARLAFEKAAQANRKNYQIVCGVAYASVMTKDYESGLESYREALGIAASYNPEEKRTCFKGIGFCLRRLKRWNEAIDCYDNWREFEIAQIDFSTKNRLYAPPGIFKNNGIFKNKKQSLNTELANAERLLGVCYLKLNDYSKATRFFERSIQSNPEQYSACREKAECNIKQRAWDDAVRTLNQMIENAPEGEKGSAYNSRAWIFASSKHDEIRDGEQAIIDATKACELTQWKNDDFIDTLATAYAETGDFENAVKWIKKAIELDPEEPNFKTRLKLFEQNKPYRE